MSIKLKMAGLPKMSAKFAKMAKGRKLPSISLFKPKVLADKKLKAFAFDKFVKKPKLAKVAKVAILKKAVKKAKNVGF